MNEGLKRHIRYVSLYQGKMIALILLGGLAYGIFLTTVMDYPLKEITNYMEMILAVIPCSLIVNYIRYKIDYCLSMGCTRRNIYLSIHILIIELLVESFVTFLLMQVITAKPITADSILPFVISELLSAIFGVLGGLLIRRFGYVKMMLILLIFYVGISLFALNSSLFMTEFLSGHLSSLLMVIGGILILYGLIVTFWGKRVIAGM